MPNAWSQRFDKKLQPEGPHKLLVRVNNISGKKVVENDPLLYSDHKDFAFWPKTFCAFWCNIAFVDTIFCLFDLVVFFFAIFLRKLSEVDISAFPNHPHNYRYRYETNRNYRQIEGNINIVIVIKSTRILSINYRYTKITYCWPLTTGQSCFGQTFCTRVRKL